MGPSDLHGPPASNSDPDLLRVTVVQVARIVDKIALYMRVRY